MVCEYVAYSFIGCGCPALVPLRYCAHHLDPNKNPNYNKDQETYDEAMKNPARITMLFQGPCHPLAHEEYITMATKFDDPLLQQPFNRKTTKRDIYGWKLFAQRIREMQAERIEFEDGTTKPTVGFHTKLCRYHVIWPDCPELKVWPPAGDFFPFLETKCCLHGQLIAPDNSKEGWGIYPEELPEDFTSDYNAKYNVLKDQRAYDKSHMTKEGFEEVWGDGYFTDTIQDGDDEFDDEFHDGHSDDQAGLDERVDRAESRRLGFMFKTSGIRLNIRPAVNPADEVETSEEESVQEFAIPVGGNEADMAIPKTGPQTRINPKKQNQAPEYLDSAYIPDYLSDSDESIPEKRPQRPNKKNKNKTQNAKQNKKKDGAGSDGEFEQFSDSDDVEPSREPMKYRPKRVLNNAPKPALKAAFNLSGETSDLAELEEGEIPESELELEEGEIRESVLANDEIFESWLENRML
ncbi:hypothetical protein ABW19_dt0200339 [Dactylella cylindrospora]|nr:hypothetical protein ABW19_dt0200339 [Dactylella cylindrospora]